MADNPNLGGAKLNAIKSAVAKAATKLSVADAGSVEAFLDRWMQYFGNFAKHLRTTNQNIDIPIVVVHVPNCKSTGQSLNWINRPMLGTNPKEDLSGTLAIVTDIGGYVNPQKLENSEQFETNIYSSHLDKYPTIMMVSFEKIYIWPDGLNGDQACIEVELQQNQVIDDLLIDKLLDQFYKDCAQFGKYWWKNTTKYITHEEPETKVQQSLWSYLLQLSSVARVANEPTIDTGRADITIRPRYPTSQCKSGVIELKTIRSFRTPKKDDNEPIKISDKDNIEWACSGVQQTASYRDAESYQYAYLCVYDFRQKNDKAIDQEIEQTAKIYNVVNRRYWISNSHAAYRDENYPLPPKVPAQ